MELNTVLYTRDGRSLGNAIVIQLPIGDKDYYTLKTDYGNVVKLTAEEIVEYFYIGEVNLTHKHAVPAQKE